MADSRWIYTPIGGGKSLFSVMELYKELERTERFCVTNLPLILSNAPDKYFTVQEYCNKWIVKPVDVSKRVFILTELQAREFWRFLPLGKLTDEDIKKFNLEVVVNDSPLGKSYGVKMPNRSHHLHKEVCDFSLRNNPDSPFYQIGCFYQIDEVHKNFPSRLWQELGYQVEDYVSELRKFNDDCDWITQHPEKCDKNLRRNATDWIQITNLSKTRLFMGVSIKKRFKFHGWTQVDMPSRNDKPDYKGGFSLGKKQRVEYTYLTMQGASVRGGATVEDSRYKGASPIIWFLAIIVIFVAAHYIPLFIEKTVAQLVSGSSQALQKGVQSGMSGQMPKVAAQDPQQQIKKSPPVDVSPKRPSAQMGSFPPSAGGVQFQQQLKCVGVIHLQNRVQVLLSDGSVADSDNGEVQDVGKRYVMVFGLPPIQIETVPMAQENSRYSIPYHMHDF